MNNIHAIFLPHSSGEAAAGAIGVGVPDDRARDTTDKGRKGRLPDFAEESVHAIFGV